jgi:hypothetical protein
MLILFLLLLLSIKTCAQPFLEDIDGESSGDGPIELPAARQSTSKPALRIL